MPAIPLISKVYSQDELCQMERVPDACGIAIFGASGDLAHRKLFPSLFKLFIDKLLPPGCYLTGIGRTNLSDAAFRKGIQDALATESPKAAPAAIQSFIERCTYLNGDYASADLYAALKKKMKTLDAEYKIPGRRIYYLSTPPELYAVIAQQLHDAAMAQPDPADSWVRVVIEKPYGSDLPSAMKLTEALRHVFYENQIYRIDHYLGKESVQNMLMFRFANAIYEPVWNRKYIDHIQITAAEAEGVGHRAGYYERAGVLRDMFQNHLFQLLSLVAMEPPVSLDAEALRNETVQVLQSLKSLSAADMARNAVRGQYAEYRREEKVDPQSTTETFAALKLEIDNWRWQGVPFYLRSGKKLPQRVTEICVQFKHVPSSIFKPLLADQLKANILNFRLQPNDGISLRFEAKHPGPKLCISTVTMEFNYEEAFGTPPPEAYARLFLDVMLGDQTLFARQDWAICSWAYITPLLDYWASQKGNGLLPYPLGSWGPKEADALLAPEGREWLTR